jgi:PAS domain S-box-containing protein
MMMVIRTGIKKKSVKMFQDALISGLVPADQLKIDIMIKNVSNSELNDLFAAVVETTSQGVCLITDHKKIAYVNDAFCNMVGCSREDVLGRALVELLCSDAAVTFTEKQKERLQGKLKDNYELCFVHGKTKKFIYTMANVSPIFDRNGNFLFSLGMLSDITEMKRIQSELDKNLARLEKAQRMAHLGFWEVNFKTNEIWWSKETSLIFGSQTPISLEEYYKLVHPEDRHKVLTARLNAMETKKSYKLQFRIIKPGGEVRHILNVNEIELDEEGVPVKLLGTSHDITEQVHKDLLVQDQRAQMIASSKLSTLGEMAGGIAHEINTPLAVVLLNAESLLKEIGEVLGSQGAAYKRVKKIISVTDRIAKIVSGLKTFSRNAERDPFVSESLNKIIEETLQLCQEKFKMNGVQVHVVQEELDLWLDCRSTQISQVLLNLLNNAFDAVSSLPEKWIRIEVRRKNDLVDISLTDSGLGIPWQMKDKIFNPFFTTKEIGQGTGIGLSTSKGLVESHHGSLWIDSMHVNTCFIVRLPLKQTALRQQDEVMNRSISWGL